MFNQRSLSQIYFGWAIVALAFCSLAFWFGIRTSFSVFYVALYSEFSWQPGALAGVQSAALIAAMVSAPVFGLLIDRFGPRKVILPGLLTTAAGLALCATVSSLSDFYLYYGIVTGSAATSIGVVAYSAVLRRWFLKNRGFASGIAVSGMGVGILIFVPLVQYGISRWGWRIAFLGLSAFGGLSLFPATACLLRLRTGAHAGPSRGGALSAEATAPTGISPPASSLYDAVTQKAFWHFILFAFFASVGVYIVLVHSVKFLVDQGAKAMAAAMVLALVGAISAVFRVLWGWMSDRIGRELAYSMGTLSACIGIGCLLFRGIYGVAGFTWLFAVFFGIGWGATAPLIMAASADIFDGRQYGVIFGLVQGVINLAGAIGAWLGGAVFGRYQSYDAAFTIAIVALVLSCLFLWKAAPRKKSSTGWDRGLYSPQAAMRRNAHGLSPSGSSPDF